MKFHLYVILPEDIPAGEKRYLITPGYCLLYSNLESVERGREITEVSTLPALAKQWLGECIEDLRREVLRERQADILSAASKFREAFVRELEAERSEQRGDNGEK